MVFKVIAYAVLGLVAFESCIKSDDTVTEVNPQTGDTIPESTVEFYENRFDSCILYKNKGSYREYICDEDTVEVIMTKVL